MLGVGGYLYLRLDDEIRRQVEQRLAGHYQDLIVRVGRARFDQDRGIAIYNVIVLESDGVSRPLLSIEEMYLVGKVRVEALLSDQLPIDEIVVRRAQLHTVRQADGGWNVKALLPLPDLSKRSPLVRIEDATVIMEDGLRATAVAQTIRGIDLTVVPVKPDGAAAVATTRLRVEGTATGMPAREARIAGEVDPIHGGLNLSVTASGLEVSSELLAALPGISAAELASIEVSGRADVALQINRRAAEGPLSWSADVKVDRGRLAHPMLPEPLSDVQIIGHADQHRLRIERLQGKCGAASVVLAGDRVGWTANAPLALAAKVIGLPVDDRMRAALPESYARIWQRFQPAGIVDAEIRLTFDGWKWRPQLLADCRGISLTDAERFPYRLEQTTGRVEYVPANDTAADQLRLDLTGVGGGQPVRIVAQLTHLAPHEPEGVTTDTGLASKTVTDVPIGHAAGYRGVGRGQSPASRPRHPLGWVEITGRDIPLHEQLIAALPETGEPLVRALRAQGAIDFRFRAEWKELSQERAEVTQEIRLKDCTVQYVPFPYSLRHVEGLVTARDRHWTIHDVTGHGGNDSTIVVCRGGTTPRGEGCHADLTFQATNVPLDDNLRLALSPPAQQAWAELRPQGNVDFTAHVVYETLRPTPVIEVTLAPLERSVSVELVKFPYRFEQIEGVATYKGGRVELRNVIARHDSTVYSAAAGTWESTPDGGWRFMLVGANADRLTPHRDLLVALPPRLQQALEQLRPSGMFGIYNSSLSFAKSPQSDHIAAAWDVNLGCHQVVLNGGMPIQSMTGGIRLVGSDNGLSAYSSGELALDSLVWRDVQFTNVHGPLWVDDAFCLFGEPATQKQGQPARRITADAYGGSLAANVEIQHTETPNYRLNLSLGGANLARFANERLGGPKDMNGTVSGRLQISGTGHSTQTLHGSGELHVVDANIYELPVLVAMLKVLHNRTPDTTAFNRCDMQFTIQGEDIHFQQLNLLGDAVSLYGKGDSGFDRRLDLVFYTLIEPANLPIPLWKTLAGQLSKQAWQLKVVGTWDNAEVRPETLPGVNQMLDQIQSEIGAGAATMAPSTATRDATIRPR